MGNTIPWALWRNVGESNTGVEWTWDGVVDGWTCYVWMRPDLFVVSVIVFVNDERETGLEQVEDFHIFEDVVSVAVLEKSSCFL